MHDIMQHILTMNVATAQAVTSIGVIEVIVDREVYKKLEKSGRFEALFLKIDSVVTPFIDDYILELLVNVPFLENRIRSH